MVSIFNTKPEQEKLQKQYEKLMKEWRSLLTTNRKESDKKFAKAQEVLNKIDALNFTE